MNSLFLAQIAEKSKSFRNIKITVCAKMQISIMKYTVFVNGLNNYSKWLLDAILNILDLTSLADLDKFTETDEFIMVFECI